MKSKGRRKRREREWAKRKEGPVTTLGFKSCVSLNYISLFCLSLDGNLSAPLHYSHPITNDTAIAQRQRNHVSKCVYEGERERLSDLFRLFGKNYSLFDEKAVCLRRRVEGRMWNCLMLIAKCRPNPLYH